TGEALAVFITAMMLMPKVNAASRGFWGIGAVAPARKRSGDAASKDESPVEHPGGDVEQSS
ncbi:MAG: hypothetical protein WD070_06825, partial [Pirellulaceae bacterium]